jgi:hypothetical protein
MKISELQKILDTYKSKYGDIEIKTTSSSHDLTDDISEHNFSYTQEEPNTSEYKEYVSIWVW